MKTKKDLKPERKMSGNAKNAYHLSFRLQQLIVI